MKYVDENDINKLPGIRLTDKSDTFAFKCHSGLKCFNLCCRNLNLFLYPYDVVRLKNRLAISSDQFLDTYVDVVLRKDNFFPEVLLTMSENKKRTCPFLQKSGCQVYTDRPDSCRTFPVEQGRFYDSAIGKDTAVSFFRPPDFCLGQNEEQKWTVDEWAADQEAETYNKMTTAWAELKQLFQKNPWGNEGPDGHRGKMAFMAVYNVDHFRDFLFNSTFLKRFRIKKELLKRIEKDDTRLMKFGFEWVRVFIWGFSSKQIRPRKK